MQIELDNWETAYLMTAIGYLVQYRYETRDTLLKQGRGIGNIFDEENKLVVRLIKKVSKSLSMKSDRDIGRYIKIMEKLIEDPYFRYKY